VGHRNKITKGMTPNLSTKKGVWFEKKQGESGDNGGVEKEGDDEFLLKTGGMDLGQAWGVVC